ncbi:hypothetical protein [Polaribacter dokdonensis]|uniref:Multi-sensor signal transduction histidine kinase n=1 Tax=Polaribacter dokdonensis DSW-5 TaxID=1300348 RepID=A0A0M9CGR9_9FLAO|nr:hypothetical protein [Polaribacter dokdonensis]KOY52311.1 Multi-sensor signal transduction histidine kinase [Polaribacter dokdonensis DSW-5]SEE43126.1 hypothetical protein SAMN05444353_1640 [Polaribacter dokdonensis DSW-5]
MIHTTEIRDHKEYTSKGFQYVLACIASIISIGVMVSWFTGNLQVLSILPGGATMKFNTALVFFLASINTVIIFSNKKVLKYVFIVFSILHILIGAITLLEYSVFSDIGIDNLFVADTISLSNSGMMSPATAICSIFIGIGFLGFRTANKTFQFVGRASNVIVFSISLLAIVSYVLTIPLEEKTTLFSSMAVHTAVLFFVFSIFLGMYNYGSFYLKVVKARYGLTKSIIELLPKTLFFTAILINMMFIGIYMDLIDADFGAFTATLILIAMYAYILTYNLERKIKKTKDGSFKKYTFTINNSVIKAEKEIRYTNDLFKFNDNIKNNDLMNKLFSELNLEINPEQFDEIWETLNLGETWSGNISKRTLKLDAHQVYTTIIPYKNAKGSLTEFFVTKRRIL